MKHHLNLRTHRATFLFVLAWSGLAGVTHHLRAAPSAPVTYTAHEWGTFTSVQGADGEQMIWNPFVVWDLPDFVYTRARPDGRTNRAAFAGSILSKPNTSGRQRMETPVIYFYAEQPLSLEVEVDFPTGILTEWFPQASAFGPGGLATPGGLPTAVKRSYLHWGQVAVTLPGSDDTSLPQLPHDGSENHYFAARGAEANPLLVPGIGPEGPIVERENFLFYRGVGQFEAPLTVGLSAAEDKLMLRNDGDGLLSDLILLQIRHGQGRYVKLGALQAGQRKVSQLQTQVPMKPLAALRDRWNEHFHRALTRAGLYEQEASAMIETWKDSWFTEDGWRVMYLLPQAWTEETLPLKMSPLPQDAVRVMVGRAELLTPSMEWEFLRQTVRFADADHEADREQAVAAVRNMALGRFAQPMMQRVAGQHATPEFQQAAMKLVQRASMSRQVTEATSQ